jgi:hypothetical protein
LTNFRTSPGKRKSQGGFEHFRINNNILRPPETFDGAVPVREVFRLACCEDYWVEGRGLSRPWNWERIGIGKLRDRCKHGCKRNSGTVARDIAVLGLGTELEDISRWEWIEVEIKGKERKTTRNKLHCQQVPYNTEQYNLTVAPNNL